MSHWHNWEFLTVPESIKSLIFWDIKGKRTKEKQWRCLHFHRNTPQKWPFPCISVWIFHVIAEHDSVQSSWTDEVQAHSYWKMFRPRSDLMKGPPVPQPVDVFLLFLYHIRLLSHQSFSYDVNLLHKGAPQRDFAAPLWSPRPKNQTEKAGEQTQHTAAANLQFTFCFFCPVFSKYKVHVYCCSTFFFSLCFTFVCFLVSFPNGWFSSYSWQTADPHTSGEQSILCCVFSILLPLVTSVSLGFLPSIILQDLEWSHYCGTGSLSSWLTHLLISITSQSPPSSSALAALSPLLDTC